MEINSGRTFQPRVPDFNYNSGRLHRCAAPYPSHHANKSREATKLARHFRLVSSGPREFEYFHRRRSSFPFDESSLTRARVQKSSILILIFHAANLNNSPHPRVRSSSVPARIRRHEAFHRRTGNVVHTRPNFAFLVRGDPSADLHRFAFFLISARAGINLDDTRGLARAEARTSGSSAEIGDTARVATG